MAQYFALVTPYPTTVEKNQLLFDILHDAAIEAGYPIVADRLTKSTEYYKAFKRIVRDILALFY